MKRLLTVGKLFIGFLFLTVLTVLVGCTSKNLAGVDQLKTIHGNPPVIKNTTGNLVSLGVVSSISSGQSISSYLDDRGLDGYGDKDWYLLRGVTSGSTITVELTGSSTGDFDLAIWKDGSWVAYDDSSSSNARLSNTAGSTTWIWVGIWSGKGSYTLRVISTSGRIIDEREVNCLAIVLMSEASIGTTAERTAVAWTVFNRVSSPRFPNTICGVAFSGAYATNQSPTQDIITFTRNLIQNPGTDPTGGATHFFSPISMPKEGDNTAGYDVGGGLHWVPGISRRIYFPSWTRYMQWVGNLPGVRQTHFMFYRP